MLSAYRKPDTCRQHHAALTGGMADSRSRLTAPLLVVAAIAAALGYRLPASSSSTAVWPAYGQAAVQVGGSQARAGIGLTTFTLCGHQLALPGDDDE